MSWWKTALYDTCSLITLDKLLQDRPSLSRRFPKKLLALEVSLSADQMDADTAKRLKVIVEVCPLPTPTELASLLQGCSAFIGHDSGISHLAAALGLPGLLLWGESSEKVWRPPSEKMTILRHPGGLAKLTVAAVVERLGTLKVEC